MKNEKSERKFDFRPMGLAIKKAREKKGMTQEQLADIIGRDTRTVMYHENDGQHPSLDIFYQLATMFDLSVDEYFYPDMSADEAAKKRINILLNSLSESELRYRSCSLLRWPSVTPSRWSMLALTATACRISSCAERYSV